MGNWRRFWTQAWASSTADYLLMRVRLNVGWIQAFFSLLPEQTEFKTVFLPKADKWGPNTSTTAALSRFKWVHLIGWTVFEADVALMTFFPPTDCVCSFLVFPVVYAIATTTCGPKIKKKSRHKLWQQQHRHTCTHQSSGLSNATWLRSKQELFSHLPSMTNRTSGLFKK